MLSFAAITDELPAEIATLGHDRCITSIKPENVDAWLNPDPGRIGDLYAILDVPRPAVLRICHGDVSAQNETAPTMQARFAPPPVEGSAWLTETATVGNVYSALR